MNYHVFIVDRNTFKYHLEYMFAGTGAGEKKVPFLSDCEANIHSTTERNLVGMIADISRIRVGDKIVFYLQAAEGMSGMFYGVFKAASKAFFDENDTANYLCKELGKPLTFRIKIEPDCVYSHGVSEHEYLDSLQDINFPYEMCWSLIYRKLKGNRGCTMITDYEFELLTEKLKKINKKISCNQNSLAFTFSSNTYSIDRINKVNHYTGRTNSINIQDRLIYKANKGNAFEIHLQAYIMQNFDTLALSRLLMPFPDLPCWIGNEVSCGVGMQRIDIMITQEKDNDAYIKIIELKCVEPALYILEQQLPWYINWVIDYVAPNYSANGKRVHIIPCVIAKNNANDDFVNSCRIFNQKYTELKNVFVEPAEYIGFEVSNDILFKKII